MKKIIGKFKILLAISLLSHHVLSFGTDLGVIGRVYPIAEDDFMEYLQKRAAVMKQNGDWVKYQNEWREKVAKNADRPHPIKNITKTQKPTSWIFDPSIILPYDLKDAKGRVFAQAGTKVNPLSLVTLHKALLFIDGDDKSQVQWAIEKYNSYSGKVKIVLINGSVFDLAKQLHQRIYFDQEGRLTSRFNIQHVPAIVIADGDQLKISEELAHE